MDHLDEEMERVVRRAWKIPLIALGAVVALAVLLPLGFALVSYIGWRLMTRLPG